MSQASEQEFPALIVMGVSGAGKSTVAAAVAQRADAVFLDADDFHPASNVAKMAAGTPLADADRWPWLEAVGDEIASRTGAGERVVVACSALKRAYRDAILGRRAGVRLVYLKGEKELIAERMAARLDHFMPPALLDSQFATLEEPAADERALVVPVSPQPGEVVAFILRELGLAERRSG